MKRICTPLTEDVILTLQAGEKVYLSGAVLTGRDAAHKRFFEAIEKGEALPVDLAGQTIYYTGPAPTKPGDVSGVAGPTTSYRMDKYAPALLDLGLKGMIGKGERSPEVVEAILRNKAVYFAAVGGAAALTLKSIVQSEVVAYEDLGTEAVRRMVFRDFPVFVAVDAHGNDVYKRSANF